MLATFLSFIFKLEDKRMCGCLIVCFIIWFIEVLYCVPWCGYGGSVQKADIFLGFWQCLLNLEFVWAFNFFLGLFLVILAPWVFDALKLFLLPYDERYSDSLQMEIWCSVYAICVTPFTEPVTLFSYLCLSVGSHSFVYWGPAVGQT